MGEYPETADLFLADIKNLKATKTHLWDISRGGEDRNFRKVDLVVASPPCQDFSYSSLPFKKARAKFSKENPPDPSIWRACERIAKELGAPLILENVRGAKKWMGPNAWHYGSFYFWGVLPALIPIGCPRKGFGGGKNWKDRPMQDGRRNLKRGQFAGEYERENGLKPKFADKRDFEKIQSPFATPSERVNLMKARDMNISGPRDKFKKMVGSEKYRKIHGAEQVAKHGSNLRKQWSARVAMIPPELSEWIGKIFYPQKEVL